MAEPPDLNESIAAELVASQFPSLRGLPVDRVAQGHDHVMFTVGDLWLVRFPKRSDRVPWLQRERSVLATVNPACSISVPQPEFIGHGSAAYPFPFFAYRRLPGVAADQASVREPDTLAADIGRTLDELHRISPDRIPPAPDPEEEIVSYESLLATHASTAATLLSGELAALAQPYLTGAMPVPSRDAPDRFIHNDICPDHLLVDPDAGRLTGLIDFADATIGDPVRDFVGLIPLGGRPFMDRVLDHYTLPLGPEFDDHLQWLSRTLTLRWLAQAAEDNPAALPKHRRWVALAFADEPIHA